MIQMSVRYGWLYSRPTEVMTSDILQRTLAFLRLLSVFQPAVFFKVVGTLANLCA